MEDLWLVPSCSLHPPNVPQAEGSAKITCSAFSDTCNAAGLATQGGKDFPKLIDFGVLES